MSNININIDTASLEQFAAQVVTRFSHLSANDIVWMIGAVVAPPIVVFLKVGLTAHFWINLILTILGYVPGQLHALWLVLFLK